MNNRAIAYVALAGALLATAITLNDRRYLAAEAPLAATSALDAELARCKTIGVEAAEDARCKMAWDANRKRFFQSGKLYQDRLTDAVPDTAVPAAEDIPPRSPTTSTGVDIAGPLQ